MFFPPIREKRLHIAQPGGATITHRNFIVTIRESLLFVFSQEEGIVSSLEVLRKRQANAPVLFAKDLLSLISGTDAMTSIPCCLGMRRCASTEKNPQRAQVSSKQNFFIGLTT